MPPGFPAKWHGLVQSRIALLLDDGGAARDGILKQLHNVGFGLVNIAGGILKVLSEIGADFGSRNLADQVVVDGRQRAEDSAQRCAGLSAP